MTSPRAQLLQATRPPRRAGRGDAVRDSVRLALADPSRAARRTRRSRRGGTASPRRTRRAPPRCAATCRASPTTARSAWNWANDVSRISRARVAADLGDQVDRHVVGRPEAGAQRVGAGGGRPATGSRVEAGLPQDDGVALDVDAAPPGAAGQLGVLPRRDVGVGLAVPLHELLQHDGARGHVDAERERLGGEHRLDQARGEQLLDDLLERRQHAGVVGGDAALEASAHSQ